MPADSQSEPPRTAQAFEIVWKPIRWQVAAGSGTVADKALGWLIIGDPESALGRALARHLGAKGAEVHLLGKSDRIDGISLHTLRGIVHLAESAGGNPPEPARIPHAAIGSCREVWSLVRSLNRQGGSRPPLWVVSRGGVVTGSETSPVCLEHSPLAGLCRSLGVGLSGLRCKQIDLDPGQTVTKQSRLLAEELNVPSEDPLVAFRGGARLAPRLVGTSREAAGKGLTVSPEAVYLVSGEGLVAVRATQWLVRKGASHILVLGRRELSPAHHQLLADLRDQGGSVTFEKVDIARRDDLARVLPRATSSGRSLRGVIHIGGTTEHGSVNDSPRPRSRGRLAARIMGAWNLSQLTSSQPLDFRLHFSSLTALVGTADQGVDAAANAFLDALAHYHRGSGQPALSINWGPWEEDGAFTGAVDWQALGVQAAPGETLLNAVDAVLASDAAQATVFVPGPGAVAPVPTILREIIRERPVDNTFAVLRQQLRALERPARQAYLLVFLTEHLLQVSQLQESELPPDRPLNTLGLDSLMVLNLLTHLQVSLGVTPPVRLIAEGGTLHQMAEEVSRQLEDG